MSEYKNKGSVILWILHNDLIDMFVVWMLAQKYDREYSGRATGRIKDTYFLTRLAKSMSVKKKTAERRLRRAFEYGFLDKCGPHTYLIKSHRKVFSIAMDNAQRQHDDDPSNYPPSIFFKGDREYTKKFEYWVVPHDLHKTKALLYGVQALQGNTILRSRVRHGKLLKNHRSTVQRLTNHSDISVLSRYLIMDVHRMLLDPSTTAPQTVDVFVESELLYRKLGNYMHGRKSFHRRHLSDLKKTFLAIQLPNFYYSHNTLKEVPATREASEWLRSRSGVRGRCADLLASIKLPGWLEGRFVCSKDRGIDNVSKQAIHAYCQRLQSVLDEGQCFDFILAKTGAIGIHSINHANARVWRSSFYVRRATPLLGKEEELVG